MPKMGLNFELTGITGLRQERGATEPQAHDLEPARSERNPKGRRVASGGRSESDDLEVNDWRAILRVIAGGVAPAH